jgi:hypothetical protein
MPSTPTPSCCRCRPGTAFRWASTACCARRSTPACLNCGCAEAQPATDGELALAHDPGLDHRRRRGHHQRRAAARDRLSLERAHGRARAPLGGRHDPGRAHGLLGGEGVAANLAGGTHHAFAHKGSGYCVFNDVAVAARLMQAEWHRHHRRLLRVLVIDLDVHQGNGTAPSFATTPRCSPCRCTAHELSVSQGGQRPGRGPARRLCRRALSAGAGQRAGPGLAAPGTARRPAWPSTWPAPTPTKATAWAG